MGIAKIGSGLFFTQSAWHAPTPAPMTHAKQGNSSGKKKPDAAKEQKKVEDAAAYIKKQLDDSGWFDTVTSGDLKKITSRIKTLKPEQRNKLIGELSDGTLRKWADEIGSPWLNTGLDGTQKSDLFKTLIPSLNGANLTRLGKAVTNADSGMADKEFILNVAGRANRAASEAYVDFLIRDADDKFENQSDILFREGGLQYKVSGIIDGELGRKELVDLSNLLDVFSPEERRRQFFDHEGTAFTPANLSKLAARITDPASSIGLDKKEKQRLFDLLSESMTGKQLADMQTALTAHDFMRALDTNARLYRETGQGQPMNSTDELGKVLENYTNRKSLEREVNDRSNFSWLPAFELEAQSLAKKIVPHIPHIKAKVPDAPVSPNGELFFQSMMKASETDTDKVIDGRKTDYMTRISTDPVNPALKDIVKDYNLDLATRMVAERSAAIVYNQLGADEKNAKGASDTRLFGDIATRLDKIKKTDYFEDQYSTAENDVSDAKWLVSKAEKHLDQYAQQFSLPRPLLAGILAAEVDFDTSLNIRASNNADYVNTQAFRAHGNNAMDALEYLANDKVKADLREAKLDETLGYLNSSATRKHLEGIRSDDFGNAGMVDFLESSGPMGIHHASLITLKLAHQMWSEGKKIPASDIPENFGDFLKNMSAPQMASIYRGYRAGTEETGGYRLFDPELNLFKVTGGDKFANAVGDVRAVMGYQAYQSEPYFEYYLNQERR